MIPSLFNSQEATKKGNPQPPQGEPHQIRGAAPPVVGGLIQGMSRHLGEASKALERHAGRGPQGAVRSTHRAERVQIHQADTQQLQRAEGTWLLFKPANGVKDKKPTELKCKNARRRTTTHIKKSASHDCI